MNRTRSFSFLGRTLIAALMLAGATGALAATTYTWNVTGTGAFGTAANWTPNRTVPAVDDILVVDGASTAKATLTGPTTQTIGQLQITNSAQCSIENTSGVTATISIAGDTGTDLVVGAGSQLRLRGSNIISLELNAAATGQVDGDVVFNSTAASIPHRIISNAAGALVFTSGSSAAQATTSSGAGGGFGGTAAPVPVSGGVVFNSGSTYYQGGEKTLTFNGGTGSNPFALTAPASAVVFSSGSTYRCITGIPASSNRTYANFIYSNSAVQSIGGGSPMTVLNNFTITSNPNLVESNLNLNQTGALVIGGNLTIESGSGGLTVSAAPGAAVNYSVAGNIDIQDPLLFTPNANNNITWLLNGAGAQSVNLNGKTLQNLNLNNAAGASLTGNAGVGGLLSLTSGNLSVGANVLTLGLTATVSQSGGSILGGSTRLIDATVTGARVIPAGTASGYTPVTVNITGAGTGTGSIAATSTNGDQPNVVTAADTLDRYWTITASGISGTTSDLTFQYLAGDVTGGTVEASMLAGAYSGGAWTIYPASINTGLHTGTVTGVTSFSDWTFGNPGAVPAELSVFSAN